MKNTIFYCNTLSKSKGFDKVYKLLACLYLLPIFVSAQVSFKTDILGKEGLFREELSLQLPIHLDSLAKDSYRRISVWAVGGNVVFQQMNATGKLPYQTMNLSANVLHLRPLAARWSWLTAIGVGTYTPENRLSSIAIGENVVASGALLFIWHQNQRLQIGAGTLVNTLLGYPMAFPTAFVEYKCEKWTGWARGNFLEGGKGAIGYRFSDTFSLHLLADASIYAAFLKKEDKKAVFFTQHSILGLQPDFTVGKYLHIPIVVGADLMRMGIYKERKLSTFFTQTFEGAPKQIYSPALYFSVGIKIVN